MKLLLRFYPILAIFVFLSCKEQPTTSETGMADIIGRAVLRDDFGDLIPPYDSILVSLDGTSISTMTDDSGNFELKNVPGGTYDFRFSKTGYGTIRWFGKSIQGGGNSPIYINNTVNQFYQELTQISPTVLTLQSAIISNGILTVAGTYKTPLPYYSNGIAIYISHSANVSSVPGSYDYFDYASAENEIATAFDTTNNTFICLASLSDINQAGFASGDSAYIVTYGAPLFDGAIYVNNQEFICEYYDPIIQQPVMSSVNQTPSPVFGLKIP
jgi:hypothetical protein